MMKFGESRRHPLRVPPPGSGTRARVLPLWPQRWRILVIDQRKPLWLPLPESPSDRRCVAHFISGRGKALYAQALLRLNEWVPRAGVLPEMELPKSLRSMLAFELPVERPWRAVIHIGAPGPEQRACVLFISPEGEALAFAKVATVPSADRSVGTEAGWLGRLGGADPLAGQVPRLLAEGTTANGRRYFVTTPAPSIRQSGTLTPAHVRFIAALGRERIDTRRFGSSPAVRKLESMLTRLEPGIDGQIVAALRAALRDCVNGLSAWDGPSVIAHGDFAPSNVRVDGDRVFVFDWEHAHDGGNPLADVLHFQLMPSATAGRVLSIRAFRAALRMAADRAGEIYPEWRWPYPIVAALAMAYLIEMVLRCSILNRCFDRADPVVRNYWQLLQRRSAWFPCTSKPRGSVLCRVVP